MTIPEQLADLAKRLTLPDYPRSASYDPAWQIAGMMGPNALWLTEALAQEMNLTPGMRVLDLGCGMALSSIFLAKEFDVHVWATDLWISANDNAKRIREAGVEDRVFPMHAEAHALPYADGFFDAIVSVDAYQYFGTSEVYTGVSAKLLKPGGQLGLVVPGLVHELDNGVPEHLQPYWEPEFWAFHSAAWWKRHLEQTGPFTIEHAGDISNGIAHWLHWERVCMEVGYPPHYPAGPHDDAMLETDQGRTLSLVRVVGQKL